MKGFGFQGLKAAVWAQKLDSPPAAPDPSAARAASAGISGNIEEWLQLNLAADTPAGRALLPPFPPAELMHNTSGLMSEQDFARHGVDLVRSLASLGPRPPAQFGDLLDFGVGVGRLARMFHGYRHRYVGVDIDQRHVEWIRSALPHVEAHHTRPAAALPFGDQSFDTVVSISVFSHLCEADQLVHLADLARLVRPGGYLFLSVHGQRALERALTEAKIVEMLSIPEWDIERARRVFECGSGYSFVVQAGHLTTDEHPYGITFISERYIRSVWSRWFQVVNVAYGAIHDFQDIVVLKAGYEPGR